MPETVRAKIKMKSSGNGNIFLRQTAAAGIAGMLLSLLLFAVTAFFVIKLDADHTLFTPLATVNAALGMLLASFFTTKKRGKNGLLLGAAAAAGVFAVCALAAYITGNFALSSQLLSKLIAILSAGGIGGLAGANTARKRSLPRV